MAIVTSVLPEVNKVMRTKRHSQATCTYLMVERDGDRVIQLNTSGSDDRKVVGATSQTLQFDQKAAKDLFDIQKDEFGF